MRNIFWWLLTLVIILYILSGGVDKYIEEGLD